MAKITEDLYYLLLADCDHRRLVFTNGSMLAFFRENQAKGLIPEAIESMLCELPAELSQRLQDSQRGASREMRG